MSFDAGAIVGRLILDKKGWDSAIEKVKADNSSLKGAILNNQKAITDLGKAMSLTGAAMTTASVLILKAAANEETVYKRLEQQLKNVGYAYSGVSEKVKEFAKEMQSLTAYGDEQVATLVTQLLPYTEDLNKAMEGSRIALDLAASGLFDVNTAAKYVGMAMSGNVEMLGRYIPELRTTNNEMLKYMSTAEKTAYTMDLLKSKFGGMAEQEAKTLNGVMSQLKNSFGDLFEAIGRNLLPAIIFFTEKLKEVIKFATNLAENNSILITSIFALAAGIGVSLTVLGPLLIILPKITTAIIALNDQGIIMSAVFLKLAVVIAAAYLALSHWTEIKAVFWSVAEGINRSLAWITDKLARFFELISKIPFADEKWKQMAENMRQFSNELLENAEVSHSLIIDSLNEIDSRNQSIMNSLDKPLSDMTNKIQNTLNNFQKMYMGFSTGINKVTENLRDFGQRGAQIAQDLASNMTNIFGNFFNNVLRGQITSAKELFVEFGNFVLSIISRLMAEMLVLKILTGLGIGAASKTTSSTGATASPVIATAQEGAEYIPYTGLYQLHGGEKVIPRYDSNKAETQQITIYNAITPEAVALAMASKEGEGVIVNVINTNSLRNGVIRREVTRR